MSDSRSAVPSEPRRMQLRYPGHCQTCGADLLAGVVAFYNRTTRSVTCSSCHGTPGVKELGEVDPGVAGASAQREYERRSARREDRIRRDHPHIGGLLLALSDDPQSTKAWATGAVGEELLGARLDTATASGIRVLHDRRIPRTRANIDHVAVGPAGVFVIDAKRYKGRPALRVEGGLLRPRTEKLMVGSRNCSTLLAGVHKQVDLVSSVLAAAGLDDTPVTGVLCFVQADWPLIGGAFRVEGLHVLWPRKALALVQGAGPLDHDAIETVHRCLAASFPSA